MQSRTTTQDYPFPVPSPILVPLDAAGRMIGCGKTTVYQYVRSGDLHIVHHGKRSTIAVAELQHLGKKLAREAGVPDDLLAVVSEAAQ